MTASPPRDETAAAGPARWVEAALAHNGGVSVYGYRIRCAMPGGPARGGHDDQDGGAPPVAASHLDGDDADLVLGESLPLGDLGEIGERGQRELFDELALGDHGRAFAVEGFTGIRPEAGAAEEAGDLALKRLPRLIGHRSLPLRPRVMQQGPFITGPAA